ncbi:serine hydrolase domain-containing protein [Pontimicrobium aquaticum]|uniref:Beta-lactamase family protein n=1 Tax=Pontimicrobium aquaticum TaxID=2565367 RepID=A0A4U0F080_9FLAO|nr:serine hydrolase domain-containing protein [Pontimicrobium aquaticum]TJY37795.1 beta-lactamase family protein [Pontimicrobium aquaticum]
MRTNSFKTFIISFALIVFNSGFAHIQNTILIDSLLHNAYSLGNFNGNALIVKNNEIIYSASFGYTDASKEKEISLATRFNIGSIYKEFSAVALMVLVEGGKLNLDDSISKFILSLPSWGKKIKVKHLLQYTSGLPNLKWGTIKSDLDILNDLKNLNSLKFEPGTDYFYNNNDISVRQFIVEKVSGTPFNVFVKERLFDPIGMKTAIANPTIDTKNIALGYSNSLVNDKIEDRFTGVIYVTAHDLLKWDQSLKNYRLIDKESIKILGQSFNGNQSALGSVEFKDEKWETHLHNGESRNFEALLYSNYSKGLYNYLIRE